MDVVSYKCPSCGAPLTFKSETQLFGCDYCESSYTLEALKQLYGENEASAEENAHETEPEWNGGTDWKSGETDNLIEYNCPSCGAQIFADATTGATSCVYCGNATIIPGQFSGSLRPDYVIPFKLNKEDAKKAFKANCKGKKLLPGNFITENTLESIKGVYVPFWLFDCDVDADMRYDATNVSRWSDSKYDYTKTDHYSVMRQGKISFDRIPVDGSSKMADEYMDAVEPYDYSGLVEFNTAFLSGYLADKYDVDIDNSKPRANLRVKNSTTDMFASTIIGYSSVTPQKADIRQHGGGVHYALMPVWMLNSSYKGKNYAFAMNGQTGKFIGELPVSKGRFWAWFLGMSAVFSAVASLVIALLLS